MNITFLENGNMTYEYKKTTYKSIKLTMWQKFKILYIRVPSPPFSGTQQSQTETTNIENY